MADGDEPGWRERATRTSKTNDKLAGDYIRDRDKRYGVSVNSRLAIRGFAQWLDSRSDETCDELRLLRTENVTLRGICSEQLVCRKCGSSDVMPWPTAQKASEHPSCLERIAAHSDAAVDLAHARLIRINALEKVQAAAQALIDDVHRRYPGEALYCPVMIALDAALTAAKL